MKGDKVVYIPFENLNSITLEERKEWYAFRSLAMKAFRKMRTEIKEEERC